MRHRLRRGPVAVAAADLGASSGRVMVGELSGGSLELREVHRFPNVPIVSGGTLCWDIRQLRAELCTGLAAAVRTAELASVGIDSWGVDYGLLDGSGSLLGNPVHYRDSRTDGVLDRVLDMVPAAELYQVTGIQQLPINTLCQLIAAAGTAELAAARTLLLLPDLLGYWLTGEIGAEVTNASTTQLLDVRSRTWAAGLIEQTGLPLGLFPPLRLPGDVIGELKPDGTKTNGLPAGLPVVAVASHDTASALVGVPAVNSRFAFISSGTWSLVGMELDQPVLSQASRLANFSNEAGLDGTIRYLRNVMGLWLLQECLRAWSPGEAHEPGLLADLLAAAGSAPGLAAVIDPDDPAFLAPGDMPRRIDSACRRTDQQPPRDRPGTVRCILDSLALAYRRAVRDAQRLSGKPIDVIHLVGGGSRNELLCQLTADACGLPVIAGPAEAAALGNVLVQLRAHGNAPRDLPGLRSMTRAAQALRRFDPLGDDSRWAAAERRVG